LRAVGLRLDIAVACCWLTVFFLTDFVFRDDESFGHRAAHVTLWLSLACYIVVAVWEHRSTQS
jgi:hypothetical protein